MKNNITRRSFLKGAGALAGALAFPTIIPAKVLGRNGAIAPSNKVTIACIGLGVHGKGVNMPNFLGRQGAEVLVLCDCWKKKIEAAAEVCKKRGKAIAEKNKIQDFREVLARPDIDAVVIATQDHWHTPMTMAAFKAGKDVFCEKPTYKLDEGRIIINAMRASGRIFMAGIEDRGYINLYRRFSELIRNGALGKVHKIIARLPGGVKGGKQVHLREDPIPEDLDYELWQGPALERPYQTERVANWMPIMEYGAGRITDWGTHLFDTAQVALNVEKTGPKTVTPSNFRFIKDGLYDTMIDFKAVYEYENGGVIEISATGTGIRAEGEKGWLESPYFPAPLRASSPKILDFKLDPKSSRVYSDPAFEQANFIDCVRSRKQPFISALDDHMLCANLHLANIAGALGRKVQWDWKKEEFINDPQANAMRSRTSWRGPWCDYIKA